MRNLSQDEMLALTTLLRAETNGLAISKVVYSAINDQDLKRMTETGIASSETRIRTLQQFLTENSVITGGIQ